MKPFNNTDATGSATQLRNCQGLCTSREGTKHNDYGTLSKAVSKHLKKKKRKDSIRLQLQLQNTVRRQIQNQQRWHSMDKLVTLNRQKNEEIKRHIYEKAALESKNQELKAKMIGPTQREQDLQRRINEMEVEMVKMRSEFQQKELKYKQQIEELKREHRKEINILKDNHEIEANRITMTLSANNKILSTQRTSSYQGGEKYTSNNNSPTRVINVYNPSSTVNYATREESPTKKSQFQNVQTIPVVRYNQNSYTNVFSQNSIKSEQQPNISPIRREMVSDSNKYYDRSLSPNTTKNTTVTTYNVDSSKNINPLRGQLERTGLSSQEYNSSVGKGQTYQYRNISQKEETRNIQSRPATFGSRQANQASPVQVSSAKGGTVREGSSSVTTKDIDDIYKRYYLHD